jgi:transcriptional regulator with XRE-family HTH domain
MTSEVMEAMHTKCYSTLMNADTFSGLLRRLRTGLRLSQEELAFRTKVSTRHLSCLETGKSRPSREMVLRLSNVLELPLRERNTLLGCAGFAPVYSTSTLDSIELAPLQHAIDLIFEKQEPYGAVLLDRCWNILRANNGALQMLGNFLDAKYVEPHIANNLVKASLHPSALRQFINNWDEVAMLTLQRLQNECAMFPNDQERHELYKEVSTHPDIKGITTKAPQTQAPFAVVHLKRNQSELRVFTLLTTIGTPLDVTAEELTSESFFPADQATAHWFQQSRNPKTEVKDS